MCVSKNPLALIDLHVDDGLGRGSSKFTKNGAPFGKRSGEPERAVICCQRWWREMTCDISI